MSAEGRRVFAVVGPDGEPDLHTVFGHERGAKVNWLYRAGVRIMDSARDEQIHEAFGIMGSKRGYTVRPFRLIPEDAH